MSGSDQSDNAVSVSAEKPEERSVLRDLLPHVLQTFKREPALAITICYLLVAMAGIFYNFNFYDRFGIPILTLSQISDFLVAGLQQPYALLLVLSTFPLCWLFDRFNASKRRARAARREMVLRTMPDSPRRKARLFLLGSLPRWFTGCIYVLLIVNYAWLFVHFYAKNDAQHVRDGGGQQVAVWLTGASEPLAAESGSWTYLGAVSNYVFVFDKASNRSVVLPINNIARLEPARPKTEATDAVVAPIR